jgi:hypothetical protein
MFGTDLGSAFAPYNSDNEVISPFLQDEPQQKYQIQQPHQSQQQSQMNISHKSTPIVNLQQNGGPYTQTQPSTQQPLLPPQISSQQAPTTMVSSKAYTPSYGLQQQGQEDPRLVMLVNELRKQQKLTQNIQNQSSYLEKLFSKKKEVLRIIYFALIIVLAMSLHFVIDHYMKFYLKNNDLSFERESIIRLLYPVSIIFILWNMKVFMK